MVKKTDKKNLKDILNEPLAIIGMNCQFPGVDADVEEVDALHEMLIQGLTPIKEVPKNRWDIDKYYDADRKKADKIISRKGGFLNNPHLFDTHFFKISPAQAKHIDPQHRLFLEVAIRALNHANIAPSSLSGSNTGVYCGISTHEYSQLNCRDNIEFNAYTPIGIANSAAIGRLCYFLNLNGPSMTVDTACSSSLSALYLGAMALRTGQCPMVIVGGVHLSLCPENFIGLSKANMLSATGKCSSFDSKADGYARAEGSGVVIVKRLSDAIKDNNTIHAIIKSIAINQNGDAASLVAPNINAQIAVHQAALEQAKLTAADIDYIEAHGTGTMLGDAVEFNAIQTVHTGHHSKNKPLIIGALKSNLGHTLSSSGIASLIKVIGAFKHETIPPNLHYSSPNPSIDPARIPAVLPVQATAFIKHNTRKRTAQVLNFGFSGTNVSVIVEEPPNVKLNVANSKHNKPYCFVVSANSEYSLKKMMANYAHYLRQSSASLQDICYTLINCRDHYQFRCAIIANDKSTLIKKIEREDYELKKVVIKKGTKKSVDEANDMYEAYLSGANIRLDVNEAHYNKVDLLLYFFDRNPYWHEPRQATESVSETIKGLDAEPIAIIGMSCRFPKAASVDAFFSLLKNGESGMSDIPLERWNNAQYYDANRDALGKLYIKQMGLIDNIKNFDADFFNISPREAKFMSPQHRVFLEACYHAIEDANLSLDSIKGSNTGVFVGCEANDYPQVLVNLGMSLEDLDIYFSTGNASSALAGHVAYAFDLHGPTQVIDTACSSSLSAIHNACLFLQSGDSNMAIAGSIKLLLSPASNIVLSKAKMLSPDSRCKTFSDDADGYARAEGCGVVVLKRLSRAIQDNDNILAVIKGSAINSDGKTAGFTVPNRHAQEAVIKTALARAQLSPSDIDYIEAHGTGTPVADPIEVNTLTAIFSEHHSQDKPLYIGSVKTNIGHCECVSGMASIIKTVLSLQHHMVFKHLNFRKLNPAIELINTIIPLENIDWQHENELRCAGVNSFGFTGANAHVVLQQVAPRKKVARVLPPESLLVLSAKKKETLELLLTSYQRYLANTSDEFADICYTAATCRNHFAFRVVIKASTVKEAAALIAKNDYTIYHIKKEKEFVQGPYDFEQLQTAYQDGLRIHWSDLYKSFDTQFEKVKLPLYEFARVEHWFVEKQKLDSASPQYIQSILDSESLPALPEGLATPLTVALDAIHKSNQNLSPWLVRYLETSDDKQLQACKDLLLELCKKIQELPATTDLDDDKGFFDIGFDSLMLTELAFFLQEKLQPPLIVTVHIGFDYPSINKLATHIKNELDTTLMKTSVLPSIPAPTDDSIAIIGMSCSLPNAPDIAAFETLLEQGLSGIQTIPIERWDNSLYYSPDPDAPNKSYVNKLGLIENIKTFDAHFFGISPREAKLMEPQQRLFLELSYKALENANYPTEALCGSLTGVFVGVSANEYYAQLEKTGFSSEELSLYSITGNVLNLISGRVAYAFDFKGPSLSIDTACSSSLVAVHYACQSLKNREIDYALAGGVNILLNPESNITLCKARALSPEGQCKTFDDTADGFVRSEGSGVVFLKRLADALRDKDHVLAVIKGSAVNSDGKCAGLTVPNGKSQEDVMLKALQQSQLSSSDISYIEAHGTGTPLGDPIEVHAINRVYGRQRRPDNPLYLASVKTNIGHLESAAGVAGLIKTVISLQKNKIYKHLNFHQLNPNITLDNTRIVLQTMDWNTNAKPKCAGVNAFGFSGTNAHVILQEFPRADSQRARKPVKMHALVLSAKSKIALDKLAEAYHAYLTTTQDDFGDICFTAATCRTHYPYRLAVSADNKASAAVLLSTMTSRGLALGSSDLTSSLDPKARPRDVASREALQSLLNDYLRGTAVDWSLYYNNSGEEFIKVTLPNYTFERREFWPDHKIDAKAHQNPSTSYESVLNHLYLTSWSVLNHNLANKNYIPEFLVISKDKAKIKKRMAFLSYQLISDLSQIETIENKNIVFHYEQGQFYDLVHCCQTMFKSRPKSFILLTENAYAIHDKDVVNPYHTMASSFWKSVRNELDFNKNYTVDLYGARSIDTEGSLIAVLNYLFNANGAENQFAVRESIYVPRLLKKERSINQGQPQVVFDSEGSYLIVGGTGGLAKPLIEYLIQRNVKHICLVSRSACRIQIRALIEEAAQQHVDIKHHHADASQYQQMKHIIEIMARSANPLKGVFHLAGVIHDGLIVNLSDEDIQTVLSAKMESALILHQLTQSIPLEQFVLFSSIASLLGGRGQANYAAANGFLDGLAHLRHQQGKPAIAINWGPFHTVGMAAHLTEGLQQHGFISLGQECIDILDTLLANQLPQISVCPMNWDLYFKHAPKQAWLSYPITRPRAVEPRFLNSLRPLTVDDCVVKLSEVLRAITADVLALDNREEISPTADLFRMGLDSLMSLEIRHRIHDQLQCEQLSLPIEYFINDPSIDKMARHIVSELQLIFAEAKDNPLTEQHAVEEVAVCDFQYLFWALNKLGYSSNVGMQLRVHGQLNKDYVYQAFAYVVKQHSAFWLNFAENAPTQRVNRQGQFNLVYRDISLSHEADELNSEFRINIMRLMPLTKSPLIRVYLYKINHDLHELQLVFPHIIVDDLSCAMVLSQFKQAYAAFVRGEKPIPMPEKDSFLNYVQQNNRHYEKDLKDKINFWRAYNHGFKRLYFGQEHHLPDAALYQPKYLFHYPIASQLIEPFIKWHKERNCNVSTGLVAACQLVFQKISGQHKIPVILIHSGREGSQSKSIVGLFPEYKRINVSLNKNSQLLDCITLIDEQLVKTAPYQKCALPIRDHGLKGSRLSLDSYLSTILNKLFLTKRFKRSKLNSRLIDYYIEYFSRIATNKKRTVIKYKLNEFFNLKMPLQQPDGLSVVISITPGFFVKEHPERHFANLEYTFSSHFACLDRPIGNHTLWIYFTKNQDGDYYLSINGPLTSACKDQMAYEFNQIIAQLIERYEHQQVLSDEA
ncbi:MAG: hypothetical protein A3F46_10645 [Legionellales bacterium RIFCSPHIGHO2_12_FULL_42_9]|nr:MAG: hypothetical protein A3F46_10645 [Legionellales bacterium RIFCSPHIGHO2_12_FULL_42_9]